MAEYRIVAHPILSAAPRASVAFYWQGRELMAREGETIASALFANGIRVFGHHPKDGSPQGIFCANGQCAQCLVLADGMPVKSCMEPVRLGMHVEPAEGLPELPKIPGNQVSAEKPGFSPIEELEIPVLIIGGGPAGMSAAIQLGQRGIKTLLIDDKDRLGGKLVLQTHRFFGSINAVYAGTRGIDIATKLENQVREHDAVEIWLNSTALAVFSDGKVGVLRGPQSTVMLSGSTAQISHPRTPAKHLLRLRTPTSSSVPRSSWLPRARGRSRWHSEATRSPASTARARSRRWSTAIWWPRPSGCSSSAAATWG